jgi:hypothetical protein
VVGIDLWKRRGKADGVTQVRQVCRGVLVLARQALALPPATVVERQRGDAAPGEPLGVGADDLLFDAGERAG